MRVRVDKEMDRVIQLLQRAERAMMLSGADSTDKAKIQGHLKQCVKRCQDVQADFITWLSNGPDMGVNYERHE